MGILAELPKEQLKKLPHPNIVEMKGKVYFEYSDKEGNVHYEYVCMPINVPSTTYDIFTGKTVYFFENPYGNLVEIKPDKLCFKEILSIANYGFEVTIFNSSYFIQYLYNLISLSEHKKSYKKLGFQFYNGQDRFFWNKMIPSGINKSTYNGEINITAKGRLRNWRKGIIKLVEGNQPLELTISVAFASIILGYIGQERAIDSSIIHFWAMSSTGKSTAAKLAASVFGSPNISDNSLISSFFSTGNALVQSLSNLCGVLKIIDDTSCATVKDMQSLVYKLANGRDKDRLTGDIERMKSGTWRCLVLTTGEKPLLDDNSNPGAIARVVEFNFPFTKDANHSHLLNEFTNQEYGTAVAFFAEKLIKVGKGKVLELYDKEYARILSCLGSKSLNERLCKVYTLIVLASRFSNHFFNWKFDYKKLRNLVIHTNEIRKSKEDIYEEILDKILSQITVRQNELEITHNGRNYITPSFTIHSSGNNIVNSPRHKFIGKLKLQGAEKRICELSIDRYVIDDIIDSEVNYNHTERQRIYKYFKIKNYIETPSGGTGYAMKHTLGGVRSYCIKFNCSEVFYNRDEQVDFAKNITEQILNQEVSQ